MIPVLVVDDDQSIRSIIRLTLEDEGYEVLEEEDGERAVLQLTSTASPIIVLLDLYLNRRARNPVVDMLVANPSLAAAHALVLMTAGQPKEAEEATISLPTNPVRVLSKPFNLDDLLQVLADASRHLAGRDVRAGQSMELPEAPGTT